MDKPLWQLGACDLANQIAAGGVSAAEAVNAAVDRMRATNPAINAVVDDLSETALETAAELDRIFARSGPVGPLHGVPVTIKENVDQAGRATPNGVVALKDLVAPADSPVVTNLKNAGAIVIGRTNTPEFSFRASTDNPLHGRTFNPWIERASAGGSSGGSASAVMSGMGALAHGNDFGGSLRYPASATGAVTVKPGLGRVPAYNPSQTADRGIIGQLMSVQGVIARQVADVRLAMKSLIAHDPHDPWAVPMPFEGPAIEGPVKVAFTRSGFGFDVHPAVDRALSAAADALTDAGYQLIEADIPNVREIGMDALRAISGETQALLRDTIHQLGSAEFNRYLDTCFEIAPPFDGVELQQALPRRNHFGRQWSLFLSEYPLVLTPLLLNPIYDWDRDLQGREGAEDILLKAFYGYSMNYLGLPAGVVSASYNDGLPIGVQIIGRRFREDMILDACEAIEIRVGVMAERLFERG